MFSDVLGILADGYTVASLAEENLRDNKDFEKIKGKNPGTVRKIIYSVLAPDKPAYSPLIDETNSTIIVAKKNIRRLQALKISPEQEAWLNDILNLYEKAIEENKEAVAELKSICQELTNYQNVNDSANVSKIVGALGNELQEIGAKILMECTSQIASHAVAFVATHGASSIATGVKWGFKAGLFIKKKSLQKAKKQQERKVSIY